MVRRCASLWGLAGEKLRTLVRMVRVQAYEKASFFLLSCTYIVILLFLGIGMLVVVETGALGEDI